MCPNSLKVPLYKGFFRGYVCQKGYPNPAPTVPLSKIKQQLLRVRERLFGLTQTLAR